MNILCSAIYADSPQDQKQSNKITPSTDDTQSNTIEKNIGLGKQFGTRDHFLDKALQVLVDAIRKHKNEQSDLFKKLIILLAPEIDQYLLEKKRKDILEYQRNKIEQIHNNATSKINKLYSTKSGRTLTQRMIEQVRDHGLSISKSKENDLALLILFPNFHGKQLNYLLSLAQDSKIKKYFDLVFASNKLDLKYQKSLLPLQMTQTQQKTMLRKVQLDHELYIDFLHKKKHTIDNVKSLLSLFNIYDIKKLLSEAKKLKYKIGDSRYQVHEGEMIGNMQEVFGKMNIGPLILVCDKKTNKMLYCRFGLLEREEKDGKTIPVVDEFLEYSTKYKENNINAKESKINSTDLQKD